MFRVEICRDWRSCNIFPENNAFSCKIGEDVLDVYTRLMQTSFFTVNSFNQKIPSEMEVAPCYNC